MKKIITILIIPIMLGVLCMCKNTPDYKWQSSINLPVFQEIGSIDFVSLILTDKNNELDHSKITYDLTSVNFNVIGTYEVIVHYQDHDKYEQTQKVDVNVVDTVKPEIIGIKDYTLNINSELPNFLLGLSATDNYDGIIILTMDNIDLSQLKIDTVGRYNVKVSVQDSSQNERVRNFTVVVVDPDVAYVINLTETNFVAQYCDNYDFTQLVQSVKNENDEDLLALGYHLEFEKENINYDSIGTYTLTIRLLDPEDNIVKIVYTTVEVVTAIKVVFNENLTINQNDELFKPEDLINQITTFDGKEVNLGEEYILILDRPIDVSQSGDALYQYTIVDKENHILFQQTIKITVKQS